MEGSNFSEASARNVSAGPESCRSKRGDNPLSKRYRGTMSRAFTKETAESAPPPERMVDEGPNLVTPEGLAQIDAHIARIESAMQTESNVLLRETLARDLRYWTILKSTAEIVPPTTGDTVSFGSTVTIERKGRRQTFRIVGVDEADPGKGLISFRSPLAQAVLGARVGDVIEAAESLGEIRIEVIPLDNLNH